MSDSLVLKLIEIVNAEIRSFNHLLELLQQEQAAIVADDLEGIESSIAAQKEVAAEAQALEAGRIQVVEKVTRRLNMEPGNATLARLLEVLEKQQGEELARMRETLLELNEKIRATNENNAFLIRQSTRYTERCLEILAGNPGGQGMYGQFGKARRNGSSSSVLNRTV